MTRSQKCELVARTANKNLLTIILFTTGLILFTTGFRVDDNDSFRSFLLSIGGCLVFLSCVSPVNKFFKILDRRDERAHAMLRESEMNVVTAVLPSAANFQVSTIPDYVLVPNQEGNHEDIEGSIEDSNSSRLN